MDELKFSKVRAMHMDKECELCGGTIPHSTKLVLTTKTDGKNLWTTTRHIECHGVFQKLSPFYHETEFEGMTEKQLFTRMMADFTDDFICGDCEARQIQCTMPEVFQTADEIHKVHEYVSARQLGETAMREKKPDGTRMHRPWRVEE